MASDQEGRAEGAVPARVLYVDWSRGFGGSSKSLGMTLSGLTEVDKLMVTAQEPDIVAELFGSIRIWPFRRLFNYRTRARFGEFFERSAFRRPFRGIATKAYAALDLLVTERNTRLLCRILRRHRVDLLHVNNGFNPREVVFASERTGVPIVVHVRGIVPPRGGAFAENAFRNAACAIAVSDACVEDLRREVPEARIVTVYDPVDIDRVDSASGERDAVRKELKLGESDLAVGIFGRIVRWKGQLEFVRACLRAMETDPTLVGVLVGSVSDGPTEYLDEIEREVEESPFRDRFRFAGYRADVEAVYAAMDVVVHASITPEPFGMVIPEAMAAARPVIAADDGGPREIVTHGVDGLRVPPGDVAALSDAILQLAEDPALRAELGRRGRQTVEERFTIDEHVRRIREIYADALQRRSG